MSVYNSTLADAEKYFHDAERLKQEILASKTDIRLRGKAYYISSDGDDENDGLYTGAHKKVIAEITIMASVRRGW